LNLNHLTPYLVRILETHFFPKSKVTIQQSTLSFPSAKHMPSLTLEGVSIKEDTKEIILPHVSYRGSLSFQGNLPLLFPCHLILTRPQIFFKGGEKSVEEKAKRSFEPLTLLENMPLYLKEAQDFFANKEVSIQITEGELHYLPGLESKETYPLRVDLNYHQALNKPLEGSFSLLPLAAPASSAQIKGVLLQEKVNAPLQLQVHFINLTQKDLSFFPELREVVSLGSLEAHLKSTFSPQGKLEEATVEIESHKGQLTLKDLLPKPLFYKKAFQRQQGDNFVVTLKEAALRGIAPLGTSLTPEVSLLLKGEAQLNNQELKVSLQAHSQNIPFDSLEGLWPENLGKDARAWVTTNLTRGLVEDATLYIQTEGKDFSLKDLHGTITFKDTNVTYMKGMPAVENVAGKAEYTNKSFNIHLLKGNTAGLTLSKGDVLLKGLDQEDQFAEILLKIKGPLQEALGLLDNPALNYIKQFGIQKETASGQAKVDLTLTFPLVHSLTPSQVAVKVNSTLNQVGLLVPLENGPELTLEKGTLSLTLEEGILETKGSAHLNQVPVTLLWRESLLKNLKSFLEVKGALCSKDFSHFGLVIDPWIEFQEKSEVSFNLRKTPQAFKMEAVLDLTRPEIRMPGFEWVKPAGVKGYGSLFVEGKGETISLKQITFKAPALSIEGKADWEKGQLIHLTLDSIQINKNDLYVTLRPDASLQKYDLLIKGKHFNLHPLLEYYQKNIKGAERKEDATPLNYNLLLDLNFVPYLKDPTLNIKDLKGRVTFLNDILQFLKIEGEMANQKKIFVSYEPNSSSTEGLLKVQIDNAGGVIQLLGIADSIQGGRLNLEGKRLLNIQGRPLKGQFVMEDFRVVDAPILAQLFSLASLTGLFDLLSGQGIIFNEAETQFNYVNDKIYLYKAQATSTAIGLLGRGVIDLQDKQLNIKGTLIPMYFFNSVLSRVPLIGELISGGEKEGLFAASYIMKGSYENPHVRVNPLSVLTPGFLRKIFFDDNSALMEESTFEEVPSLN